MLEYAAFALIFVVISYENAFIQFYLSNYG